MQPLDADALDPRWSVDDLDELPDDGRRYECVDGGLLLVTPPSALHQLVLKRLMLQLDPQVPEPWALLPEAGVQLSDSDWRIPDLVVAREPWLLGRLHQPGIVGLVVEVVSPTSQRTDRLLKPAEYAAAGLPYYWRVETDPGVLIAAHTLAGGWYGEPVELAEPGGVPAPFPVTLDIPALDPR